MIRHEIILVFLVYFAVLKVDSLRIGSKCTIASNNAPGVCRHIKNCEPVLEIYRQGLIRSKPPTVCNNVERSVCCPTQPSTSTVKKPKLPGVSKRKCKEYAENVYQLVKSPSTIFGEPDVTKKISKCFNSVSLIVNGEAAKDGEFPHMALLGYEEGRPDDYSCGGSLISENFVLTAAHCLYPSGYGAVKFVKIGMILREQDDDKVHTYNVKEIYQHPNYVPNKFNEDIGLLKLDRPVVMNERIRPICLPQAFNIKPKAITIGFGKTGYRQSSSDHLLKVVLESFTQEECQRAFGNKVKVTNDTVMCYGHRSERKDACNGDSGGPLQVLSDEPYCTYTQIGVVSYGLKKCGTIGSPGVYVNIFHYLEWIENIVWSDEA